MDDIPSLNGPAAYAWLARETAKEKSVPFFDLTGDDVPGPSRRVKQEFDDGTGSSGVKKEDADTDEHPYLAFRRRHGGR